VAHHDVRPVIHWVRCDEEIVLLANAQPSLNIACADAEQRVADLLLLRIEDLAAVDAVPARQQRLALSHRAVRAQCDVLVALGEQLVVPRERNNEIAAIESAK
tara:strand:+ start:4081 stop:4389 length:309 start_codon:yes stop_codon:yes gene_type:complete